MAALTPQQLLEQLEITFAEMVGIVYRTLKNRQCATDFLGGMPLRSEMMWLINAHRFTLHGMYAGAGNSDYVQNSILRYLLRLWNSYRHHFRKLSRRMQRRFGVYARYANLLREQIVPSDLRVLLPVIVPDQTGQAALFWHMAEELRREIQQISISLATLPYRAITPVQEVEQGLKLFAHDLADMQQQLKKPTATDTLCPASWLYRCLSHIQELYARATVFFLLTCENQAWQAAERLRTIVWRTYPALAHIEKNYPRAELPRRGWRYLAIFNGQAVETAERLFFTAEGTCFTLQPRTWMGLRLGSDYAEEIYPALQQFVMLYLKTAEPKFYEELIGRWYELAEAGTGFTPWLGTSRLRRDVVKEMAYALLSHTQGQAGLGFLEILRPLLLDLDVELVWARNVNNHADDTSLVEHRYVFAEPPGNYLKQNGLRVDDNVLQRAIYLHKIWPRPAAIEPLHKLRLWLCELSCSQTQNALRTQIVGQLESMVTPRFWCGMAEHSVFQEQQLLPALREVVHGLDSILYGEASGFDKRLRVEYESAFNALARSLIKDGWQIVLLAGKCSRQLAQHHRLPTQLSPLAWQEYVAVGYPLPLPDFRRPLSSTANPALSRLFYCRAYEPELLAWCRRPLPAAFLHLQPNIETLARLLLESWPEAATRTAQQVVDTIVNPLAQQMLAARQSDSLRQEALEFLSPLRDVLERDHLPLFWPEPSCVGSDLGSLPQAAAVRQASELEYMASPAPKGTVLAILRFGLDWDEVRLRVSSGPADEDLCLFGDMLAALNELCRRHTELLTEPGQLPQPLPPPDSVKIAELATLPAIWPQLVPELLPLPLRDYHVFFAEYNGELHVGKLQHLATLLALCDRLGAVFFPETAALQKVADRVAQHLDARKIAVDPLLLAPPKSHAQTLYLLWPQPEILAIVRRRIAGHSADAVVIKGSPRTDSDDALFDAASEILPTLRRLYAFIWCHLARAGDPSLRAQVMERWQAVYYQVQAKARLSQLLEFINLFYSYRDLWQPFVGTDAEQSLLAPIEKFLEQASVVMVRLENGEIFGACHAAYFDRQETLLPHAKPPGTIIQVLKPAFFHSADKRLLQKGRLLVCRMG
jgi:hypothetical protein